MYKSSRFISNNEVELFHCENRCCQLTPYTKYTVTFRNKKSVSSLIILNINQTYYSLKFSVSSSNSIMVGQYFNKKEENFTEFGKVHTFLPNEDLEYNNYVIDVICTLNYAAPWYDAESARNLISRILNIKAFS